MSKTDWAKHHELTKSNPPSELLFKALEYVGHKGKAIDIGDGGLKDARYLLDQGFDVTVVDQEEQMNIAAKAVASDKLHCFVSTFADFVFKEDIIDLASAMFALPFNPPETFDAVLTNVKRSLVKGGIFCGQLFGTRDEWSNNRQMTFHTKEQVDGLFADMEVLSLVEREMDGYTADGTPKHWHLFHIIAKKL